MNEHTKQALRDYVGSKRKEAPQSAMTRAIDALAERMYQDYDHYREAFTMDSCCAKKNDMVVMR